MFLLSKRAKIRWISYAAAVAVCLVGVLASAFAGAKRYEARINADTARALATAVSTVNDLDLSLQKCACALTPAMQNRICTEVFSNAKQAELALSVLPVKSVSLEQIARHLSVVGDYAFMLSRMNEDGMRFSEEDMSRLKEFSETTSLLNESLFELQRMANAGEICNEHFDRITDSLNNLEQDASAAADTLEHQMDAMAASFPSLKAVRYDGAFSDDVDAEPAALRGLQEVTEQEAKSIAAVWIGCAEDQLEKRAQVNGKVPCYCFDGKNAEIGYRVAVTKSGGMVLWMSREAVSGDATLDEQEAVDRARSFLASRGYQDLSPVRGEISGGEMVIRFVYLQDGELLCYPDAIDVTVSLANGEVTGFDAERYMMHHTRRDTSVYAAAGEPDESAIPSFLKVDSVRKAVLDGFGSQERFCWQVDCADFASQPYRIFLSAASGEQEEIVLPIDLQAEIKS